MRRKPYKPYSREFKLEAIRLAEVGDKTASQVARELGLRPNQIWKWKQQLEREAAAGGPATRGRPADDELASLRRENARLKEENELLGKRKRGRAKKERKRGRSEKGDAPLFEIDSAHAEASAALFAGVPHHITQRGNRRENVFFSEADREAYLEWLTDYCAKHGVEVLAYCLMTNHIHVVAVPEQEDGLERVFRPLHTRYAQRINRLKKWKSHLWQGRFFSSALDDAYLCAAIRYVRGAPWFGS